VHLGDAKQTWYKRKFFLEKKNKKLQNKACHDTLPRYLKPLWPKSNPLTEMESQTKKFSKGIEQNCFQKIGVGLKTSGL
jgi:hypothetical protein